MVVQDEVTWLLETIKDEWPDTSFPDDLARINRDGPKNLRTGEHSVGVDLERFNAVGVSLGSVQQEPYGTKPQYDVTTTLDVRVEAKPERDRGLVVDDTAFNILVRKVQAAINSVRVYPDVDPDADDLSRIVYLTAQLQDETRLASGHGDYYRTDFTVRLDGNADTP